MSIGDKVLWEKVTSEYEKPVFNSVTQEGVKGDAGKQMAGLMVRDFANALRAVAGVTTFGAEKYAPSNWLHVHGAKDRYTDALFRHLLAWACGEEIDEESVMLHLSHAAWNILALIELDMRGL